MRLLILGGDGMLGHQLFRKLRGSHEVRVTLRLAPEAYDSYDLFKKESTFYGIDARQTDVLRRAIEQYRPEAVVNAIGIVKQRSDAKEVIPSLEINSLLPHRLAELCRPIGARLVHLSTDCVFSGRKGHYCENDVPDAEDLYGRTKVLGEVSEPHCLTLRTSMIGPELSRKTGLLEWFLGQKGRPVKGFTNAIFSGFPTVELSRIIEQVLVKNPSLHGVYHVASEAINKYDLLTLIRDRLDLPVTIEQDSTFVCDRSLDASRFRKDTGYSSPPWEVMIDHMALQMKEK